MIRHLRCLRSKEKGLGVNQALVFGSRVSDSDYISHTVATLYSMGFLFCCT